MNVARVASLRAGLPVAGPGPDREPVLRLRAAGHRHRGRADRRRRGRRDRRRRRREHEPRAHGREQVQRQPRRWCPPGPRPTPAWASPPSWWRSKYGVSRADQDAFAAESHRRAARAQAEGWFAGRARARSRSRPPRSWPASSPAPPSGSTADEGVRGDTTVEGLAKLKPAFQVDGTVTAGNASQMTDGAAAVVVVSERYLKESGAKPLARFVSFARPRRAPGDHGHRSGRGHPGGARARRPDAGATSPPWS